MEFTNTKKEEVKLKVFLFSFFYTFLVIFVWLFWLYIFNSLGIASTDISGSTDKKIIWKDYYVNWCIIFATIQVFVIIVIAYFINNYIKNKNYVYGVIIAIIIYAIIFGSSFVYYGWYRIINNEYYFVWSSDGLKSRILINTLVMPWSIYGILGKALISVNNPSLHFNGFNMSQMNNLGNLTFGKAYSLLIWVPVMYLSFFTMVTIFHNKSKIK